MFLSFLERHRLGLLKRLQRRIQKITSDHCWTEVLEDKTIILKWDSLLAELRFNILKILSIRLSALSKIIYNKNQPELLGRHKDPYL